ncbi:hypothetical protein D3C75_1099820 [compost metagenome]
MLTALKDGFKTEFLLHLTDTRKKLLCHFNRTTRTNPFTRHLTSARTNDNDMP